MSTARFTLAAGDRINPLWRAIEAHLTDRLATLREQNDSDKSPDKTAHLRGQIAEVKLLLALAEDRPKVG